MGSGTLLTKDMRNRRRCENQCKHNSLVDTARDAPEPRGPKKIRDPRKICKMAKFFGDGFSVKQQTSGICTASMYFYKSLADMGEWQQTVLTGIYARLPGATKLAQFAGSGSKEHYIEGLLDPSVMPEFKGMVQALCEDLPDLLEEHKQARQ